MRGERRSAPAVPMWARSLDEDDFSFRSAVGGPRGVVESILPGLIFVILYVITNNVIVSSLVAGGSALIAVVAALIGRTGVQQALTGLLGVAIGVAWALITGRGENFYAWGLLTSALFLLGILASLALRAPLVAVLLGLFRGYGSDWREDPARRPLVRRCRSLTWMWAGMFALRLAVQVPLWAMGAVAELGVAKLVLGVPLFALVCWATWIGLRPFHDDEPREPARS